MYLVLVDPVDISIEKKPNEEISEAIIFQVQLKFWPLPCGIKIEHLGIST